MSSLILVGHRGAGQGGVAGPVLTPVPVPTPTPPAQPVVLPANARYARDALAAFGLNVPFAGSNPTLTAQLLGALGCRKVRMQLVRDNTGEMIGLQAALTAGGYSNPKLRLNVLLNGYIQDAANNFLSEQEPLLLKLAAANILHSIEGSNEINDIYNGQGTRGPNDTIDKTGMVVGGPAPGSQPPSAAVVVGRFGAFAPGTLNWRECCSILRRS